MAGRFQRRRNGVSGETGLSASLGPPRATAPLPPGLCYGLEGSEPAPAACEVGASFKILTGISGYRFDPRVEYCNARLFIVAGIARDNCQGVLLRRRGDNEIRL
jgi:hypothetical protein